MERVCERASSGWRLDRHRRLSLSLFRDGRRYPPPRDPAGKGFSSPLPPHVHLVVSRFFIVTDRRNSINQQPGSWRCLYNRPNLWISCVYYLCAVMSNSLVHYLQMTILPFAIPLARRTRFGCQALTAGTVVRTAGSLRLAIKSPVPLE